MTTYLHSNARLNHLLSILEAYYYLVQISLPAMDNPEGAIE